MEKLVKIMKPQTCVGKGKKTYIRTDEELRIIFSRHNLSTGIKLEPGFWYLNVVTEEFGEKQFYIHDDQLEEDSPCRIDNPLQFIRDWYYSKLIHLIQQS